MTNALYLRAIFENSEEFVQPEDQKITIKKIKANPNISLIVFPYNVAISDKETLTNLIEKTSSPTSAVLYSADPTSYNYFAKRFENMINKKITNYNFPLTINMFPGYWTSSMVDNRLIDTYYNYNENKPIDTNRGDNELLKDVNHQLLLEHMNTLFFDNDINCFEIPDSMKTFMFNSILGSKAANFMVGMPEALSRLKYSRIINTKELLKNFVNFCFSNKDEHLSNICNNFLLYDKAFINSIQIKSIINDISNKIDVIPYNFNNFYIALDDITYHYLKIIINDGKVEENYEDLTDKLIKNNDSISPNKLCYMLGAIDSLNNTKLFSSKFVKDPYFFLEHNIKKIDDSEFEVYKKDFYIGYNKVELLKQKLLKDKILKPDDNIDNNKPKLSEPELNSKDLNQFIEETDLNFFNN